ncbi:hypothetical protein B0J11DRAFT_521423 [Dendryphion nanum]|uniref:NAD(P)-binding protein n=1 Tax=Dendryphion nanum TaxID=256645 RepID=A0A9P9IU02_9PLEO|nr:hypothetical protein B0J11DRAFT_521423 [Dendryphion nanum]
MMKPILIKRATMDASNRPHHPVRLTTQDTMTEHSNRPLPVHRLSGIVALITGGGCRTGVETARRLLREGANVCLVDHNAVALEAAANTLKEALFSGENFHSRILTVVADVTSETDVERYTKLVVQNFGRLDTVFLNAGISNEETSIFETTVEDFDAIMNVNVKSAFLGIKHSSKTMKELGNGGSIILSSSIAGLQGIPGLSAYSGAKFALRGLALTAAQELGHDRIRVNTIHPSGVDGPLFGDASTPEKLEEQKDANPLGRFAQVDDIASVVAFLASEDSKFMTGGALKIDGGCVSA